MARVTAEAPAVVVALALAAAPTGGGRARCLATAGAHPQPAFGALAVSDRSAGRGATIVTGARDAVGAVVPLAAGAARASAGLGATGPREATVGAGTRAAGAGARVGLVAARGSAGSGAKGRGGRRPLRGAGRERVTVPPAGSVVNCGPGVTGVTARGPRGLRGPIGVMHAARRGAVDAMAARSPANVGAATVRERGRDLRAGATTWDGMGRAGRRGGVRAPGQALRRGQRRAGTRSGTASGAMAALQAGQG